MRAAMTSAFGSGRPSSYSFTKSAIHCMAASRSTGSTRSQIDVAAVALRHVHFAHRFERRANEEHHPVTFRLEEGPHRDFVGDFVRAQRRCHESQETTGESGGTA